MKMKAVFLLISVFISVVLADDYSCRLHSIEQCESPGIRWNSGKCNSIYGGFLGNSENLSILSIKHIKDSFKYLIMSSYFNTAEMNRMGFHKFLMGYSDKMWENGKKVMKYIVQRGGSPTSNIKVEDLNLRAFKGELQALTSTLDMLKELTEDITVVYKHAQNKHAFENRKKRLYDPSIIHFIEENLLEDYSERIRDVAGKVNVLGGIVRNEKTKFMGLHIFDQSL